MREHPNTKNTKNNSVNAIKGLSCYFPEYFFISKLTKGGLIKEEAFKIVNFFFKLLIKLSLNLRKEQVGDLDKGEVEQVYKREAKQYDVSHHLTTRGQDLIWRRQAGFFVLNYFLNNFHSNPIKLLDLCTGTGLTVKEICRVLEMWRRQEWQLEMFGLDYCQDMLKIAEGNTFSNNFRVNMVRGDATSLVFAKEGFATFKPDSIDLVTQVFGIGGIDKPLDVFREVLKVLKVGGQYYVSDMHKPIKGLSGEWFMFGKWLQMPYFEERAYSDVTVPLILERKWAWRDTTELFYFIRLVTVRNNEDGACYGFRVMNFEMIPQRWWFSLPVMPVARIIVEKEEISREELERRNNFLKSF